VGALASPGLRRCQVLVRRGRHRGAVCCCSPWASVVPRVTFRVGDRGEGGGGGDQRRLRPLAARARWGRKGGDRGRPLEGGSLVEVWSGGILGADVEVCEPVLQLVEVVEVCEQVLQIIGPGLRDWGVKWTGRGGLGVRLRC